MTNEDKEALIDFLKFLVAGSAGQHRQIYEIALAALTAQPVKLPDNVPCKGAPQFVWLQVNCDTGNPSEWPDSPGAGVTWHTEQIHSDDVLYIRANNDEVQE